MSKSFTLPSPFRLPLESILSNSTIPKDFCLVLKQRSVWFNRTVLAASSRCVSSLLISDPLATSLPIDDPAITEVSLRFLKSRSEPLTSSTVLGVSKLGIALQNDSLFDFAIRSPYFGSLAPEIRLSIIEIAFTSGLDIRGAFAVPASDPFILALPPHLVRASVYCCEVSPERRRLLSDPSQNPNYARNRIPAIRHVLRNVGFVKRVDYDPAGPFEGIFAIFESAAHFFKADEFSLVLKLDAPFILEPTDFCVRANGNKLSPNLQLLALVDNSWRRLRLNAAEKLLGSGHHFSINSRFRSSQFLFISSDCAEIEFFGSVYRSIVVYGRPDDHSAAHEIDQLRRYLAQAESTTERTGITMRLCEVLDEMLDEGRSILDEVREAGDRSAMRAWEEALSEWEELGCELQNELPRNLSLEHLLQILGDMGGELPSFDDEE